jgi:predicted MFS family arabinose efflux permease
MATGDTLGRGVPIEKSPTQDSISQEKPPLSSTTTKEEGLQQQQQSLSGWRLRLVLAATFIGLCLSLLDTTIVAVSLPTIAEHFDEFDRSTWIINAYIITYMAFSIVIARLSDIFSCRSVQAGSFTLFIAFSLGCALSTSMTQL